jgi:ribose-phosphate pyrophosphokinase
MRKRRQNKVTQSGSVLGDVSGRTVILIDDEINSGRTVFSAGAQLKACGATSIFLAVAHSLFTPEAAATSQTWPIDRIIVADCMCYREYLPPGVELVSISEEIASVMRLG